MIYAIFSVFYSIIYTIPDSCDAEWSIAYLRLDIQRLTISLIAIDCVEQVEFHRLYWFFDAKIRLFFDKSKF